MSRRFNAIPWPLLTNIRFFQQFPLPKWTDRSYLPPEPRLPDVLDFKSQGRIPNEGWFLPTNKRREPYP